MSLDTLPSNANEVIGRLESLLQASLLLRTGLPKNIFASTGTRLEQKKKKNSSKHLAPSLLILATSAPRTATADKLPANPSLEGRMLIYTYIILHIEVTASLQQNLDHREMTLIGSKVQGGPAMLSMQRKQLVSEVDTPRGQDTKAKRTQQL